MGGAPSQILSLSSVNGSVALGGPPAGPPMPCVLIGSCSLSLESALVVDLAQIGGAPRAREKAWPQAGCCGGKEGTSSWGGRCRGPRRNNVQSWHRVAGRGPRALPGWEPQAPLPVAMDGSGNEQPDCVEQGQTPVGGTPKGGGVHPLMNVHRWSQ